MALWVDPSDTKGVRFDDGLAFMPDEEGFQPKPGWNYIGTPNWHLRIEAEAKDKAEAEEIARLEADAKAHADADADARRVTDEAAVDAARTMALKKAIEAELAQRADPQAYAKAQQIAAIEAEHAAMADMLVDDRDALKQADTLKAMRLAELEPTS